MRPILASSVILLVFTGSYAADTIVLKNGRRIVADQISEEDARIVYETHLGKFSLAKSLIDHIDHDGAVSSPSDLPPSVGVADKPTVRRSAPVPAIVTSVRPDHVIVNDKVNRKYLDELVHQDFPAPAPRDLVVAAFLSAEDFEIGHGRLDSALEIAKAGTSAYSPADVRMLMGLAVVYLQRQEYRQARDVLIRARIDAPDSPLVWKLIGFVEYSTDRMMDAVVSWKKSLSLAPDPEVEKMLERAERESAAEVAFQEANSNHFTLRFEGGQVTRVFSLDILDTLEKHFRDLERDLEIAPPESITVILYPGQAFYDVTQAASWTGALYDGKIRVPIEGLTAVTPQLSAVLKHEMTHSFVRARSQGKCPAWLNEGLAQLEEGRSSAPFGAQLLEGLHAKHPSLAMLGAPFGSLPAAAARGAYMISLAAVEMLRDKHGIHEVARLLDRLAAGESVDNAMLDVVGYTVPDADAKLIEYLKKR